MKKAVGVFRHQHDEMCVPRCIYAGDPGRLETQDLSVRRHRCEMAPPGWWCSRMRGHAPPCALRQLSGPAVSEPPSVVMADLDWWSGLIAGLVIGFVGASILALFVVPR